MEFVLTGFRQEKNVRQYAFQSVAAGRRLADFTVGVDLSSVHKYGIPQQELPLLCRRLLEENPPEEAGALMYTEIDMAGYAKVRATQKSEADAKKRAHFRPPPNRNAKRPE